MPSAITCDAILSSASTKGDGSLNLRFSTPEMTASEKTVFFELLNINLKLLIQPVDSEPAELKEVRGQFETKTPSQRLRSVLYIRWRQASGQGEFETFYHREMDGIINSIKQKLEPKDT